MALERFLWWEKQSSIFYQYVYYCVIVLTVVFVANIIALNQKSGNPNNGITSQILVLKAYVKF